MRCAARVTIHGGQGNRDLTVIRTLAVQDGVSPTVTWDPAA
jgi:hypothetical protein